MITFTKKLFKKGVVEVIYLGSVLGMLQPRGPLILTYHRISSHSSDRNFSGSCSLAVSLDIFERQIRYLKEHYILVSLDSLIGYIRNGVLNGNATKMAALTFDDGYKDTYELAYPILRKYDVPATIFLTTQYLDRETVNLWWCELADLISEYKGKVIIRYKEREYSWFIDSARKRRECYGRLGEIFMSQGPAEQDEFMKELREQFKAKGKENHKSLMLTWDMVKEMVGSGLISIGNHTVSHPALSTLSKDAQEEEIRNAKQRLEDVLGIKISSFAYPYGAREHYSHESIDIVKKYHDYAVTTVLRELKNGAGSYLYELPRTGVLRNLRYFPINLMPEIYDRIIKL